MRNSIFLSIILAGIVLCSCGIPKTDFTFDRHYAIGSVDLEKRSVCINEDVMVAVNPALNSGPDTNVVYHVGEKVGNPVILRFSSPGVKRIPVVVKDMVNKTQSIAEVEVNVKDCECEPLVIEAAPSSMRKGFMLFSVHGAEDLGEDVTYHWDFGDGTRATIEGPVVTHDYRQCDQKRFMSSFVVKVKTRKGFIKREGRKSISIMNTHYISATMGSPTVPVSYERFLKPAADRYTIPVSINNIYEYDIEFDEVEIIAAPCGDVPSQSFYAEAGNVMDNTIVPSDGVTQCNLLLDKSLVPDGTCFLTVRLWGPWENESLISAKINLDIVPDINTTGVEKYKSIKNQILIRKLNKASEIVGPGNPITPEMLEKLEKEGKL